MDVRIGDAEETVVRDLYARWQLACAEYTSGDLNASIRFWDSIPEECIVEKHPERPIGEPDAIRVVYAEKTNKIEQQEALEDHTNNRLEHETATEICQEGNSNTSME